MIKLPSVNREPSKEGYCIHIEIDDINSAQQLFAIVKEEVFLVSKFILSILYEANINCFFKTTNLFGISLDKDNKQCKTQQY